jgi:hypothetical protein
MEKTLEQLIQMLRDASPTLWAAAQSKVHADIYASCFWAWILGVTTVVCLVLVALMFWKYPDSCSDSQDAMIVVMALTLIAALACGSGALHNIYKYQMLSRATDYYAIHALAELIQAAH